MPTFDDSRANIHPPREPNVIGAEGCTQHHPNCKCPLCVKHPPVCPCPHCVSLAIEYIKRHRGKP